MSGSIPSEPSGPVATVPEVIARMESLVAANPATDGVACFIRMYLTVTREVARRIGAGFFADPDFMTRLDVVFANFFFVAVDGWSANPRAMPRSWTVLFARRTDRDIAPLQFALAGMNAHINHDLPQAVVATCRDLGTSPHDDDHEADYDKVNVVLGELSETIRQSFETGIILELDRQFDGLENVVSNFSISAAREVAWANALTLWHLSGEGPLADLFLEGLDRTVAFAGRGLLLPVG
jgi:Family of unknown function (DUF5995)